MKERFLAETTKLRDRQWGATGASHWLCRQKAILIHPARIGNWQPVQQNNNTYKNSARKRACRTGEPEYRIRSIAHMYIVAKYLVGPRLFMQGRVDGRK